MHTLMTTTTGIVASQLILTHCGDYAGDFQSKAFDILNEVTDLPDLLANHWADIMFDQYRRVYAIWAEDSLTSFNAALKYIMLDIEDCPEAFVGMREKW